MKLFKVNKNFYFLPEDVWLQFEAFHLAKVHLAGKQHAVNQCEMA